MAIDFSGIGDIAKSANNVLAPLSTILGGALQVKGAQMSADSLKAAADARMKAAEFANAEDNIQAGSAVASGQRAADVALLNTRLVNSTQLARAAASGAGASDPTITRLMAFTRGIGSYNALSSIFEGEDQARKLIDQGKAALFEGATGAQSDLTRAQAYGAAGKAAIINSAGSLFSKYGQGGPPKLATTDNAVTAFESSVFSNPAAVDV